MMEMLIPPGARHCDSNSEEVGRALPLVLTNSHQLDSFLNTDWRAVGSIAIFQPAPSICKCDLE